MPLLALIAASLLGCADRPVDSSTPPVLVERAADLVINELLADNDTTIQDEDGDLDDWVELYNRGEQTLDLTGYQLTDGYPDDLPWTLPEGTTLAPGGYLLVWCDGDEEPGGNTDLHADFKLRQTGELITLIDADHAVIDQVAYPHLQGDISYARMPDGGKGWFPLDPPSPLGPNERRTPLR